MTGVTIYLTPMLSTRRIWSDNDSVLISTR